MRAVGAENNHIIVLLILCSYLGTKSFDCSVCTNAAHADIIQTSFVYPDNRHARSGSAWIFITAGLMKPQNVTMPMMMQMIFIT